MDDIRLGNTVLVNSKHKAVVKYIGMSSNPASIFFGVIFDTSLAHQKRCTMFYLVYDRFTFFSFLTRLLLIIYRSHGIRRRYMVWVRTGTRNRYVTEIGNERNKFWFEICPPHNFLGADRTLMDTY